MRLSTGRPTVLIRPIIQQFAVVEIFKLRLTKDIWTKMEKNTIELLKLVLCNIHYFPLVVF